MNKSKNGQGKGDGVLDGVSRHTPGPWILDPKEWQIFSEPRNKVVCDIEVDHLSQSGESEFNAYLIAAAPELLKALKYVDQVMDYDGYEDMRDKVKGAIAKAT